MTNRIHSRERIITPDMLQSLPPVVQRYLNYTGVVGKHMLETVRLSYHGKFRLGADKPWMPMSAHQTYTINPPGFCWNARFSMGGLPLLIGRDIYKAGHSHMHGKLAGLFTVVEGSGPEVDQGTMIRYLQEMTWFPIAYLNDYITWQGVDDHCADVTFSDAGQSVTARMYFDDRGRLMNFVAQRYGDFNGKYAVRTWTTPVTEYGQFEGLQLPVRGMGVWQLPEGDMSYIDITIKQIEYNQPIEEF